MFFFFLLQWKKLNLTVLFWYKLHFISRFSLSLIHLLFSFTVLVCLHGTALVFGNTSTYQLFTTIFLKLCSSTVSETMQSGTFFLKDIQSK